MPLLALWLLAPPSAAEPLDASVRAKALRPGEAAVVVVRGHDRARAPEGSFLGRPLRFFSLPGGRWAAFAGLDLEQSTGTGRVRLTLRGARGAERTWERGLEILPARFPERRLRVENRYVELSREDEARAEAESKRLSGLFAGSAPGRRPPRKFSSPIPGAPSARFGERRFFNDQPRSPHTGADLAAKAGTPVRAPAAGRVAFAGELFFSGNAVVLDHGWGVFTFYGHLSRIDVRQGAEVAAGRVLGRVGQTGRATGPHLHWSARVGGARVDPFALTRLPLADWLAPPREKRVAGSP